MKQCETAREPGALFAFECFTVSYVVAGCDLMGTHLGAVSLSISLLRQETQNVSAQDRALLLLVQGYNNQLSELKTNESVKFVQGWWHGLGKTLELRSEKSHSQTL